MNIRECVKLIRELKEISFTNKSDRTKLINHISPTVTKLRNGKKVMKEIRNLVNQDKYDEAIKYLKKASRYSRFWPLNEVSDLGVILLFVPFFVLIGAINIGIWHFDFKHTKDSENWPLTTGIIILSEVHENTDDDGYVTSHSPNIEFSYTVFGKKYTSDYYDFSSESGEKYWADSITDQFPVNSLVDVYYHPEKHRLAVLKPGFNSFLYGFPITGYGIVSIAILILVIKVLIEIRGIKKNDKMN